MPQANTEHGNVERGVGASARPSPINFAAVMIRGVGSLYDLQVEAARLVLQSQARTAAAFGLPDYSGLFGIDDERAKHLISAGTDYLLNSAQQAKQTISEVHHHVGRLVEQETINIAESWRYGIQELNQQTEEGLTQFREMAKKQVEEVERTSETLHETARQGLREGGEQSRESMQEIGEQGRRTTQEAGEQVRDTVREGEDVHAGVRQSGQAETRDKTGKSSKTA